MASDNSDTAYKIGQLEANVDSLAQQQERYDYMLSDVMDTQGELYRDVDALKIYQESTRKFIEESTKSRSLQNKILGLLAAGVISLIVTIITQLIQNWI